MLKIQLIGHLGQDAKINNVNGVDVLNFSVAHTESYKNKEGNKVDKTVWINCQYWDNTKLLTYLTKGRTVFVEGFPSANSFKNKEGVQMTGINCRVLNLQFIGKNATPENKADDNSGASNDFPPMNEENGDSPY